ncbi:GNAT family N-acetyltransferase [Intrasporangium sp.]|uniref:GNAT family N-acetyltransferase n=1 Tax=Intrasporangium sp. TaxID=1925024 RepID=UPI002B48FE5B|nr:GNAT family N-acetyltransferase [Intrasporangium sp.]
MALDMTQPPVVDAATTWINTPRLGLRRPVEEDLADYVRLHTDPRTYVHKPTAMATVQECGQHFAASLERWRAEGIDYAPVEEVATGQLVGWAGLRVVRDRGEPHLNLYYRLEFAALGRGLGRELARGVVSWAAEHRPDLPVRAAVAPVNDASLATALAAGLVEVGREVHPDFPEDEPDIILRLPEVAVVHPDGAEADAFVDLWGRVNDAGGAVGFLPGAPVTRVRAAFDKHAELVRAGRSLLIGLREPDGTLRGFGFWEYTGEPGFAHVAWLKRLMIDPTAQGRNWGALLLAGMVGIARRALPDVTLLLLDYRSGLGLGDFYERAGWAEVGRIPGAIWLEGDEYRDDVFMARRIDGVPLVTDGRT